jgi:hypothetical protein
LPNAATRQWWKALTDNGARAEKLKDALGAGTRNHCNLEESVLDTITAVARSARPAQDLTRGEPHQLRLSHTLLQGGKNIAVACLAALAGVVHDRQRADGDEHHRDDDNC